MDVVVYDGVAVLEVLALANAIGSNEKVDFTITGEVLGTLL